MGDDTSSAASAGRGPQVLVVSSLALLALCWILAMPRSAGPDEPSHVVRGAALVRGELDGQPFFEFDALRGFELPAYIGFPDPACYAFEEYQPASCTLELERPTGRTVLGTRSQNYPIWGHLLPGLGTFAPAGAVPYATRALDALVPVLLLAGALLVAARRGWLAAGAVVLAITPMAWFSVAVVNPSGLVIAGGVGLWVGLLAGRRADDEVIPDDRLVDALVAGSYAAMVLPRRDGLVWASIVVAIAVIVHGDRLLDPWRRRGLGARIVIVAATVATFAWAVTSRTESSKALLLGPLVPVVAVGARWIWRWARARGAGATLTLLVAAGVAAPIGMVAVMDRRAAGFDRVVFREVVRRTGDNLYEAIGVLGWLDTPVPSTAVFAWFVALGVLVGVAVVADERAALAGAGAVLGTGLAAAWVLTMLQNDDTGTYWQGRYYLPLLVGVTILLGRVRLPAPMGERAGRFVAIVGAIVGLVALTAASRRFGVGSAGSLLPWDWDTYDAPVPPVVLLVVAGAASAALLVGLDRTIRRAR